MQANIIKTQLLHPQHHDNLCDDDTQEHGKRIHRSISHRGFVARKGIVHIVQRNRISHCSAKHARRCGK